MVILLEMCQFNASDLRRGPVRREAIFFKYLLLRYLIFFHELHIVRTAPTTIFYL